MSPPARIAPESPMSAMSGSGSTRAYGIAGGRESRLPDDTAPVAGRWTTDGGQVRIGAIIRKTVAVSNFNLEMAYTY
jgi:hypothetical protein